MPFSFSQSAIERRMNKALGKGKVRLGRNGEAPNFVQVNVTQRFDSQEDEEHVLSLIRDALITMTRTGDIADEFVALVEFDGRTGRGGLLGLIPSGQGDMDIRAEWRAPHNIEEVLASKADRIANQLIRLIRYPDSFICLSTSFAGDIRTGSQLSIGRARERDLVISDPAVGSSHAVISRNPDDDSWYLIDLGSVNGTTVDGTPLRNTRQQLREGSTIVVAGRHTITVTAIEKPEPAPPKTPVVRERVRQDLEEQAGGDTPTRTQPYEQAVGADEPDESRIPTPDLGRRPKGSGQGDVAGSGTQPIAPTMKMDQGAGQPQRPPVGTDGDSDAPELPDTLDK